MAHGLDPHNLIPHLAPLTRTLYLTSPALHEALTEAGSWAAPPMVFTWARS